MYDSPEMDTTREVMELTIDLERQTMRLYTRLSAVFARDPKLKEFWFAMARDEALHVGALELVSTVLELEGKLELSSPISIDNATVRRLTALLERHCNDAIPSITIADALRIAVDIEESEVEDMVGDLLKATQATGEYQRYLRLLVHDLGDLSYMIEQYCHDSELLGRCDRLVNRHAEALRLSALH
jgi:rubrerythrin